MIRWLVLLSTMTCSVALADEPEEPSAPNPFLAQAKRHHQNLEFEKCVQRLRLAPQWRSTPEELKEIELYSGLCHFGLGRRREAAEHLELLLKLDPASQLPPYTSPKIEALFQSIRERLKPPVDPRGSAPPPPEGRGETATASSAPGADEPPDTAPPTKNGPSTEEEPSLDASPDDRPLVELPPTSRPDQRLKPDEPRAPAIVPLGKSGPPPPRGRELTYLFTGTAIAAAGVGLVLGVNARTLESRANAAYFAQDGLELGEKARSTALAANISYGVALAAASTAIIFLLAQPEGHPDDRGRTGSP